MLGWSFLSNKLLINVIVSLKDIIGEITAVKSTVNDSLGEKDRIMATIKLDKYFLIFSFLLFPLYN